MECTKAREKFTPFIQGKTSLDEIEEMLEHLQTCEKCREESELYYYILVGLAEGTEPAENADIKEDYREYIRSAYHRIHVRFVWRVFHYALSTLVSLSVLLALALQFRIWWMN